MIARPDIAHVATLIGDPSQDQLWAVGVYCGLWLSPALRKAQTSSWFQQTCGPIDRLMNDLNPPLHVRVKGTEVGCLHSVCYPHFTDGILFQSIGIPPKFIGSCCVRRKVFVDPSDHITDADLNQAWVELKRSDIDLVHLSGIRQQGNWNRNGCHRSRSDHHASTCRPARHH